MSMHPISSWMSMHPIGADAWGRDRKLACVRCTIHGYPAGYRYRVSLPQSKFVASVGRGTAAAAAPAVAPSRPTRAI